MDDGEEYTVSLVVLVEDEPEHTEDHPHCDDVACPCNAA